MTGRWFKLVWGGGSILSVWCLKFCPVRFLEEHFIEHSPFYDRTINVVDSHQTDGLNEKL